ncbi:MAG: MFS transporter [Anaerolineae bacterium]
MGIDVEPLDAKVTPVAEPAAEPPSRSVLARLRRTFSFMRGNLLVITLTRSSGMFARTMTFPYASLYILALGGNPEQVGLINSLSPLASPIVFPIGGYLADHRGRVGLLGWTSIAMGLVYGLYAVAPSWPWLLACSLLVGFGVISMPANSAITADSLSPADRGRGISLSNFMSSAPAMVAPLLAAAVFRSFGVDPGMRYLYTFLGISYAAGGFVNMRLLKETTTPSGPPLRLSAIPRILKDTYTGVLPMLKALPRSTRGLGAMVILGFIGNVVAAPFWVLYAVQVVGLDTTAWATILLIEAVVRDVGYVPAGFLVDRIGRVRCMRLALILALLAVSSFVFARGFVAVLIVRMAISVASATYIPAGTALMADTVPRALRGRTMAALGRGSVFLGSTGGGMGGPGLGYLVTIPAMLASFSGGYLYAADPRLPWLVSTIALLSCLAVSFIVLREQEQAEA